MEVAGSNPAPPMSLFFEKDLNRDFKRVRGKRIFPRVVCIGGRRLGRGKHPLLKSGARGCHCEHLVRGNSVFLFCNDIVGYLYIQLSYLRILTGFQYSCKIIIYESRGINSGVEYELPKLGARVQIPYPAHCR